MEEVFVWQMAVDEKSRFPVVLLKEKNGSRKLPIWIGPAEAQAIAMELQGKRFQRPLTHDLMATILKGVQAEVRKVEISSLKENTFFAKIVLQHGDALMSVDARPSDSIALALRMKAPIFASSELLTDDLDTPDPQESEGEEDDTPRPPTPDERADSARRFIEEIDPEDFGKFSF